MNSNAILLNFVIINCKTVCFILYSLLIALIIY